MKMIYDRFSRPITGLRISVTDKCNLNCFYCHREGISSKGEEELTPEEIARVVRIGAKHGVTKVKLTGGEPLLRKDIIEIVEEISGIDEIEDISMTTNGILLSKYAEKLRNAGLNRINISLDTLNPEKYRKITGGGDIEKALSGIDAAIEAKLKPVKINVVVMRGINENEIFEIIDRFSISGVVVQLIEMVSTNNKFFEKYFYNLSRIEEEISKKSEKMITRQMHNRKKYILGKAEVEFVRPMHNTEFCMHCTRLRVTADGKFKPCLMRDDNLVEFLHVMRGGASDEEIEKLFFKAIELREPYFKDSRSIPERNASAKP